MTPLLQCEGPGCGRDVQLTSIVRGRHLCHYCWVAAGRPRADPLLTPKEQKEREDASDAKRRK